MPFCKLSCNLKVLVSRFFQECIANLVSADDEGNLRVWKSGEEFQLLNKIPGFE